MVTTTPGGTFLIQDGRRFTEGQETRRRKPLDVRLQCGWDFFVDNLKTHYKLFHFFFLSANILNDKQPVLKYRLRHYHFVN